MIINPKVVKKGISEEQLEAWAEVNTALEKAVGPYTIEPTTASYFTFDGNACTSYVGDNTLPEIVIPRSYSTVINTETVVGAKVLDKFEIGHMIRDFISATFSDGENNTHVYSSPMKLYELGYDFPNDCYLVSMQGSNPSSFNFLLMASDMRVLQFPIVINGHSFSDGGTARDYIIENNITDVNFGGDIEVISYVDGNDYQVTSVSSINNVSGFKNYQNRIILLSSVTSIGNRAFSNCSLTSIDIPSSVTSIGDDVFYNCYKLENITVDPSNTNYCSDEYGVLFNKDKTELIQYPIGNIRTQYTIPSGVTSIGEDVFFNCSSLTSIDIPSSVTSIGDDVFEDCISLTSIDIPSGVTSIGDYAFRDCISLTSVTFEDNSQLGSIGLSVFSGCTSLASVIIPDSVTSIRGYAFYNCTSLVEITVLAETPPTIQADTFLGVPNTTIYYVPDASVDAYKTATNWTKYADQIQPLSAKGGTN